MNLWQAARNWVGISFLGLATGAFAADTVTFDLRIVERKAEGGVRTVRVPQGAKVVLRIRSDEAMKVHVHGYDVEQRAKPGEVATVTLEARWTGRFPVTAHLPPSKGAHGREPTLLYLEVHPE